MEVKLEVRRDYVLIAFTGSLSLPMVHQALRDGIDAAADSGLHRILFDWSGMKALLTTGQRLEFGEIGAAHALGKTWRNPPRLAAFGSFPALNGLAAMVASNRGFSAQAFPDERQALDWLGIGQDEL